MFKNIIQRVTMCKLFDPMVDNLKTCNPQGDNVIFFNL